MSSGVSSEMPVPVPEPKVGVQHDEHDIVPEKNVDTTKGDLSAQWLSQYDGPRERITTEQSEQVRKRIDRYLLPMYVSQTKTTFPCRDGLRSDSLFSVFYIYFSQQLDKQSLSFASVFGIQTDANLT